MRSSWQRCREDDADSISGLTSWLRKLVAEKMRIRGIWVIPHHSTQPLQIRLIWNFITLLNSSPYSPIWVNVTCRDGMCFVRSFWTRLERRSQGKEYMKWCLKGFGRSYHMFGMMAVYIMVDRSCRHTLSSNACTGIPTSNIIHLELARISTHFDRLRHGMCSHNMSTLISAKHVDILNTNDVLWKWCWLSLTHCKADIMSNHNKFFFFF